MLNDQINQIELNKKELYILLLEERINSIESKYKELETRYNSLLEYHELLNLSLTRFTTIN